MGTEKQVESQERTSLSVSHYVSEEEDGVVLQDKDGSGEVDYVVAVVFRYPAVVFMVLFAYCVMCAYFTVLYFDLSDPFAGLR